MADQAENDLDTRDASARSRAFSRRAFLQAGLAAPLLGSSRSRQVDPSWRTFEITVRVSVADASGPIRLWLPLALPRPAPYQRTVSQQWTGTAAPVELLGDPASGAPMLIADWPAGSSDPSLTLTIVVTVPREHRVSLERPQPIRDVDERLDAYLRPTRLIPTTGIVRDTAEKIVRGHATPLTRARAIYDWIVDNTFRDPAVQGCGLGDIRWMLETGSLGGKCADLNGLFVGLCRSVKLPARDLYGLRIAASERFTSLGKNDDVTASQHCRAEVWVDEFGWIPVDPADVRKVVLEEDPIGTVASPQARFARAQFFGSWEMNWMAFNDAHDVALPGSKGPLLPFLMYPQVEIGGVRRNSLDAAAFRYGISAKLVGPQKSGDLAMW